METITWKQASGDKGYCFFMQVLKSVLKSMV